MEKKDKITQILAHKFAKILVFFSFIFIIFSVSGATAEAASLYFSPASGSYAVGHDFSVGIYVSSADQAMNAASGIISFPSDKLEVTSLSQIGSIFNFWVNAPAYANTPGTISFQGVVFSPGYSGKSGKIITITFKAKAVGAAALSFSSGSVLANDGNGTAILSDSKRASYSIVAAPKIPVAPPAPAAAPIVAPVLPPAPAIELPLSPIISSPTHPDITPWYNSNNPQFTWTITPDITADRIFYDKVPNSRPKIKYTFTPPLAEKQFSSLADGVWYLQVQLQNKTGWGDIAHYRFQIDTTPPEQFTLTFVDGQASDNPRPPILLSAVDVSSGLDFYQLKIDGGEIITVPAQAGNTPYILPPQDPGEHTIFAQAFDRAGNYATTSVKFTINAILPPVFTKYPYRLSSDETLVIEGTTSPDSNLNIWLQKGENIPQKFQIGSDKNGNFIFVCDEKLAAGTYRLWGEPINERGTASEPSAKLTIIISQPLAWLIGSWNISLTAMIITFLALIIFFDALFRYLNKRKNKKNSS